MLQVDILQHVTTATLTLSDIDDVHLSPSNAETRSAAQPAGHMTAYLSFAREQRRLLPKGLSSGEREKLLGTRWKALSKAEKAQYCKGCMDTAPNPNRSAYTAFCRAQRLLLPPSLPNAKREAVLGRLWAELPERERTAYRLGGSRAPLPAPAPPTPSALPEQDDSQHKRARTAASMVSPAAPEIRLYHPLPENTAVASLAPPTAHALPFFVPTAPSSASTSPTTGHSLSTDINDADDYDWEKYLRLDEGFISSALASPEALQQTWE